MLNPTKTKPFVWSFSALKCYRDICPHQFYRRYIVKDVPFVETPAMVIGNDVHSAMEMRVGGNKPLPDGMQQFEPICAAFDGRGAICEQKLGITSAGQSCDFFDPNVWGRGKLDLTVLQDSTAYLGDHKSGKIREDPFELEVQAVLLHAKHPQLKKIYGQFIWLKENKLGKLYDVSHTSWTWEQINKIVLAIKEDQTWEKRKSGLCSYCGVLDCEFNRNNK